MYIPKIFQNAFEEMLAITIRYHHRFYPRKMLVEYKKEPNQAVFYTEKRVTKGAMSETIKFTVDIDDSDETVGDVYKKLKLLPEFMEVMKDI